MASSKVMKMMYVLIITSSCMMIGCSGFDLNIPNIPAIEEHQDSLNEAASMPCMQKLLPCQPYLSSSESAAASSSPPPPPICCMPLKEMLAADTKCLCTVVESPSLLQKFNFTKDQAMKIPMACGATTDLSVCKTGGSPTTTTGGPGPAAASNSSNNSSSDANTSKTGAPPPAHDVAAAIGSRVSQLAVPVCSFAIVLSLF